MDIMLALLLIRLTICMLCLVSLFVFLSVEEGKPKLAAKRRPCEDGTNVFWVTRRPQHDRT